MMQGKKNQPHFQENKDIVTKMKCFIWKSLRLESI